MTWTLTKLVLQLGMTAMFGRESRLRDISSTPIAVSDILHKAEMKVDEQGAMASAASGRCTSSSPFNHSALK